ncbi:MFS transporter [Streptomyces halobius]|uniref:MFS transporter n=1 Tax=Streptomyces halobius TaxID=2879846 RepID=A0ABY4M2T5_9ACTN|nr:MFS transporter [Streptomyces halobius]UQA90551.1 MFS transporter [Streptomyces halobius]
MAIACGLAVAGNYFAQPLVDAIRTDLGLGPTLAALVVTAAQAGYAVGLVFLVPLGDLLERRKLAVSLTALSALLLAVTAVSQNGVMLLAGTALTGLFSVAAQVVVPYAATLAAPEAKGKAVGTVMSGLLLGILLSRTAAGLLAEAGTWRTVYWVNSILMAIMAVALWFALPSLRTPAGLSYPALLRSVASLLRTEPVLRIRCYLGFLAFAAFGVLWTALGFMLASDPYNWDEAAIGLFGFVGAAGALMAISGGRLADKGYVHQVGGFGTVLLALSWIPMALGKTSLIALLVGVIVLDLAVQAIHLSNQNIVFAIKPEARNRLNSAYMTFYFLGGTFGSASTSTVRVTYGWGGVCILGALVSLLAVVIWGADQVRSRVDSRG